MNQNEKKQMKKEIGEHIDLGNGRYKDDEIERLKSIVDHRDSLIGKSQTTTHLPRKGFDREGTYSVTDTTTYTINKDERGMYVEKKTTHAYDDGTQTENTERSRTGREILNIFYMIKKLLD